MRVIQVAGGDTYTIPWTAGTQGQDILQHRTHEAARNIHTRRRIGIIRRCKIVRSLPCVSGTDHADSLPTASPKAGSQVSQRLALDLKQRVRPAPGNSVPSQRPTPSSLPNNVRLPLPSSVLPLTPRLPARKQRPGFMTSLTETLTSATGYNVTGFYKRVQAGEDFDRETDTRDGFARVTDDNFDELVSFPLLDVVRVRGFAYPGT